jgi:hypothetical protein
MAIQVVQGQVAVSDPSPNGPNVTSNIKDLVVKVVKLTSVNFTTGGTNTLVAMLPADATIIGFEKVVKTQLAGGGITAATIGLGNVSAGTQFLSAYSVFDAAGVNALVTPATGTMQNYGTPLGADIPLWVLGTATTGNPTSGEIYLVIKYVR